MKAIGSLTLLVALTPSTGSAADAPGRPEPPGPHVRKVDAAALARTAFRRDQPIAGTYYFYWFDAATGEHFIDPDGTDALTDHPDRPEGYSYRSADWHRREILDVLAAGLDFILPVYWGYPDGYSEWSFTGLPPLVEACRRLEHDGTAPPRIGLFYDTSTLQWNRRGFHADLTTRFVDHGVKGIYEEANYFSKGGELAELRTWIIAKTLWDSSYDTERAITEFLEGYYEEAAASLRDYIRIIHEKARSQRVHYRIFDGPKPALFSREVLDRATAIFDDAEGRVESKPRVLHRVRVARLPLLYVEIADLLRKRKDPVAWAERDRARLANLAEAFDATAKAEGVTHVSEHRRYDPWIMEVQKAATGPAGRQ